MENLMEVKEMLASLQNNLTSIAKMVIEIQSQKTTHVDIKLLNENAKVPTRGSVDAAGYDLYACLDTDTLEIPPHTTAKVSTGLSVELPNGTFGAVFARSGLATKKSLRPANCVGKQIL